MLGFCLRCLTSDWKSGSSWSGPVIASVCLDPFFTQTAVVEKLYSVINWVKHCLVDECYEILYIMIIIHWIGIVTSTGKCYPSF